MGKKWPFLLILTHRHRSKVKWRREEDEMLFGIGQPFMKLGTGNK
jgi:hypothetical protein